MANKSESAEAASIARLANELNHRYLSMQPLPKTLTNLSVAFLFLSSGLGRFFME
ncbi:hypothetical protein [Paenibacillus durus]|uniref:hypothetical protein n=1 Tax=Paenibacillus durus TaxID=44251 RepID=UPI000A52B32D|nr:hypothetical protein [Paenibacillus durus]